MTESTLKCRQALPLLIYLCFYLALDITILQNKELFCSIRVLNNQDFPPGSNMS